MRWLGKVYVSGHKRNVILSANGKLAQQIIQKFSHTPFRKVGENYTCLRQVNRLGSPALLPEARMPHVVEDIPPQLQPAAEAALAWINQERGAQFKLTGLVAPEQALTTRSWSW